MLKFLLGTLTLTFFFAGGWAATDGYGLLSVVSCLGGVITALLTVAAYLWEAE